MKKTFMHSTNAYEAPAKCQSLLGMGHKAVNKTGMVSVLCSTAQNMIQPKKKQKHITIQYSKRSKPRVLWGRILGENIRENLLEQVAPELSFKVGAGWGRIATVT